MSGASVPRRRPESAKRSSRIALGIVLIAVVLIVVAVTAMWWSMASQRDPIDSAPVSATALVLESPSCSDGDRTVVRISGVDPAVHSQLDGCGFAAGQRLTVEYLDGHPETARLAGASPSGASSLFRKVLPIVMLVSGLVAVGMMLVVATRYRGRRRAGGVSVADLQRRIQQARESEGAGGRWTIDDSGAVDRADGESTDR